MHILHVYKDYYPVLGGIENHIKALAEAQVRRGHQVTVLVTNPGRDTLEEERNGVRVIKVGRVATVASTPLSPAFARRLRFLQPDVTHLQSPYPVGEVAQWFSGRGRPYVISYQADVSRPLQRLIMLAYGPLFHRLLRGASFVLATSPNYANSSPYLRAVADRVRIVPLGVAAERFTPRQGPRPPGPVSILFVGQLRHYKGVEDLLRAVSLLRSDVRLLIAGDGPMRAEWETLQRELNLTKCSAFLGRVPDEDLPALYQAADIFVLPANSRAESFGTVLLEAMASGLPCVTTEIGSGNSYVVQEGVTGWVVPPRSPGALAEALRRLVNDSEMRARMGAAGRERVLSQFTVEKMIEGVEAVYRETLEHYPQVF
jgi:rhamnosyl/mannosyltransferase